MKKPLNKHQEHFEDMILTGDLSVLDFFNSDCEISLKIDGSPAIVFGTNPANNQFFVSTKSAFNKVKIKLCHSHEEIDTHFQGKVANILHCCFNWLPHTDSIIQGDFLGFGDTDVVQPNTISYRFSEVVSQNIIFAPHTVWHTDGELKDAYVIGSAPFFADTENVKFVQPCVDYLKIQLPDVDVSNIQFLTDKQAQVAKQQINAIIRDGHELEWWNVAEIFECRNLAHLYLTMIELKDDIMQSMIVHDSPRAFIGDDEIIGEGFVCKNDSIIFKLVNRYQFSHANFNSVKSW